MIDFKKGQYYTMIENKDSKQFCIFKSNGEYDDRGYPCVSVSLGNLNHHWPSTHRAFNRNGINTYPWELNDREDRREAGMSLHGRIVRLSTPFEISLIEASIRNNRAFKADEIRNHQLEVLLND